MMPTCEHRWCHKTAEKVIEVYYLPMDKRTSEFADRCIYLCKRHYDKIIKKLGGGEE